MCDELNEAVPDVGNLPMQRGMAALPDLHVSDSSEAMLSGRKPPFRLLVRAAHRDGRKVNIRHAVSEGFVVSHFCRLCAALLSGNLFNCFWALLLLAGILLTKHISSLLCIMDNRFRSFWVASYSCCL